MKTKIFSGTIEQTAPELFLYQYHYNKVYRAYCDSLKIRPNDIKSLEAIPFLPIEFFKSQKIISELPASNPKFHIFSSSGTGKDGQSMHYVSDISVYKKSFRKTFELFYGNIEDYAILALLPSYLERQGSSLVYMVSDLIAQSKNKHSGFYLHHSNELIGKLELLGAAGQKTILLGVTYALLDLAEKKKFHLKNTIVMETGGMKGKRKEMVRGELHKILCEAFGVGAIQSEYGMTELLSQAYAKSEGIFHCPPWMHVLVRDTEDPFTLLEQGRTGGINIIDLANINSCAFIATQDLGRVHKNGSFEVLGRFDNSDIRGCNLLVE